jgi:hypothetical protein
MIQTSQRGGQRLAKQERGDTRFSHRCVRPRHQAAWHKLSKSVP